tara:strand:+ start:4147 stop:5385 length:1239 start_codon:yes stop_codon:yes gene_type:complete
MKKIITSNQIGSILILGLLLRLIAYFFYADTELKNEWAILFHNFKIFGIYGYNIVLGDFHAFPNFAQAHQEVLPSVFMPPLYFFFICLTEIISFDLVSTVNLLIFSQIFLNLLSIVLLYKLVINFEKKFITLFVCLIFAIFPLNVYAAVQVSSITLQIFLILSFLFFLVKLIKKNNSRYLILFSISAGLLILIRGEFFLFYFLTLIYFLIIKYLKIKTLLLSIIISTLIISPYLTRNYLNFNTVVLTKSFGYNLLKGNNPTLKVEGNPTYIEANFKREDLKIRSDKRYEINLDNFYKEKAFNIIKDDPVTYFKHYCLKLFSFIFMDFNSSYPNYYNLLHLVPKIIFSLSSLVGAIIALQRKGFYQFMSIFYFSNIFLFSIFFILPRYSLILLPVQLFLSIFIFKKLFRKYLN